MDTNNSELYIVTGAAGNLGSAIVRNLVSKQKSVRAFVLRGEEAAKHLPKEAQVIEGDVTDISTLETLFADIPENTSVYCIHCAAMELGRQRVETHIDAFDRGIKRFQIDGEIDTLRHTICLLEFLRYPCRLGKYS